MKNNQAYYDSFVHRAAGILAQLIQLPAVTVTHVLSNPGSLAPDLLNQVQNIASAHPGDDLIIFIQRGDVDQIVAALETKTGK